MRGPMMYMCNFCIIAILDYAITDFRRVDSVTPKSFNAVAGAGRHIGSEIRTRRLREA